MNTKVETVAVKLDILKLVIALLILASAVAAFYFFADESQLLRVVGLLAATGISVGIALQTEKGRTLWAFIQDAQVEVRKVVWPTRQETLQTTAIVIIAVIVFAIILGILDWGLGAAIESIIGQGA
ncbi:MAG: preprotein translocase subunit SecE [Gammaproteobacteria bacterium]|jgi:preprotein translocase subunit SecE